MPIARQFRPFYRGPGWEFARRRTLERAGGRFAGKGERDARGRFAREGQYKGGARCEHCGRPDGQRVFTWSWKEPARAWGKQPVLQMVWADERSGALRDKLGRLWSGKLPRGFPRHPMVRLQCAHLNHIPGDDGPGNVVALCGWCHTDHDRAEHARNRGEHKDLKRPALAGAA